MSTDTTSSDISGLQKWCLVFVYLLRKKRAMLLFIIITAPFALWLTNDRFGFYNWGKWEFWDPLLSILTLAVAAFVWWGEISRDWEDNLAKRLTVYFLYPEEDNEKDRIAIVCEYAYLAGESDIRALGQSIGQQINGAQLPFTPNIQQNTGRIEHRSVGIIKHYQVLIKLKGGEWYKQVNPDQVKPEQVMKAKIFKNRKTVHWNCETNYFNIPDLDKAHVMRLRCNPKGWFCHEDDTSSTR